MESCCNPRGLYGSPERTSDILLIYFPSLIWFEHKDHCSKFLIFVKHENDWKMFILSESIFKASFSPSVKCEVGKRKFFQDPWLIFCFLLILSQKKVLSEAFFCYCNTRFNHTRLKCLKQLEFVKTYYLKHENGWKMFVLSEFNWIFYFSPSVKDEDVKRFLAYFGFFHFFK